MDGPGGARAVLWLSRSQISTSESSAPEANVPLREGDHSMQFMAAACPLSSSKACPGCRTSSIRIMFESCENVARRWVSCGDAASRSRGGAYDMVC
jgi:hypothetical protein